MRYIQVYNTRDVSRDVEKMSKSHVLPGIVACIMWHTYMNHLVSLGFVKGKLSVKDQFSVGTNISTIWSGTHSHIICLNF